MYTLKLNTSGAVRVPGLYFDRVTGKHANSRNLTVFWVELRVRINSGGETYGQRRRDVGIIIIIFIIFIMMPRNEALPSRMTVTELGEFLRNPPVGVSVEVLRTGYRVHCDPEDSLLLLDDFHSCTGERVAFHKSLGRKVKMQNLWEYTSMRKRLLSKRIYLLVSACQEVHSKSNKKTGNEIRVLKQFVVSIDGNDPFIKWQMEKGLNWTISSVAGESYRVDIDLTEAMESWARKNIGDNLMNVKPVWKDASFTLKYSSDALFDFPHWFGLSKRKFTLRLN
ncbi:unnamed protein product [Ophioblennius macclurei]